MKNNLLKNIWVVIAGNSLLLLGARVLSKVGTILVTVYAARMIGSMEFGKLNVILAVTSIAGLISDFGLVLPSIRSMSVDVERQSEILDKTISARIFWSIVALFVVEVILTLLSLSGFIIFFFAVSSVFEIFSTALIRSFEARLDMKKLTVYLIVERMIYLSVILTAIYFFKNITSIAVGYLCAFTLTLLIAVKFYQSWIGKIHWSFTWKQVLNVSKIGFPFLISSLFSALYYKSDVVLLAKMKSETEAGLYSAAMRIIEAQMFIPLTLMNSIYPILSKLFQERISVFKNFFIKSLGSFLAIGSIIAVAMFIFAPLIIRILYGSAYSGSSGVLKILSVMLLIYFVNFLLSQTLFALGEEIFYTIVLGAGMLVNIIVNWNILPVWGMIGAAWMRVITELCIACALLFTIWMVMKRRAALEQA